MGFPPVAATSVGSFPRPGWLAQRVGGAAEFVPEGSALDEAKDDATRLVIREQEAVGLDLVTDGEQRRTSFINHVIASLDGIDMVHRQEKVIRRKGVPRPVPTIAGKVRRRQDVVVADLRFAKAHAANPVKIAVPGPMTVVDSTFDETYGDEPSLAMDIAAALNEELLALQAAGADALQIDEPAMTRWPEKVADHGAAALDRCLEGITVPTFVHLCYGYQGGQDAPYDQYAVFPYPPLLEMLMGTRIGGFSVEFERSRYDPAILAACEGRNIMFGCVDPSGPEAPSLEHVVERVRQALKYVPAERLLLSPDCGLMTVSRELAHAKVSVLAQAAAQVRSGL